MSLGTKKIDTVKLIGYCGIIGILITIISDFIMLSKPDTGITFFINGTSIMEDIALWRIETGTFLGVVALPFSILGLVPIYYALKPSGKVLSGVVFMTGAHALVMGAAFHMSFAYMGRAWKMAYDVPSDKDVILKLMMDYDKYWYTLIIIMLVDIIICSLVFVYAILRRKTLFQKWVAIFNPLLVIAIVVTVMVCIHAPIGGIVSPTSLNLSMLIIVIITMFQCHKKVSI